MSPVVATELLLRYDRPGPRYTSYPTAPAWSCSFAAVQYAERLAQAGKRSSTPVSLYVHIPYCASMCWYCACSVVISKDQDKGERYVDLVLAEAGLVHRHLGGSRPVLQHHWGGGTPTSLRPAAIERLFRGLHRLFPPLPGAELSVEVDPRVTTRDHLVALAAGGCNRISMGVQDFDRTVQQAIHREQSFEMTAELIAAARQLGFQSINLDLVYGLPHQTEASFARSLALVHQLAPDRVACYSYAHVPWLKKHQQLIDEAALPRGLQKLQLYRLALEHFTGLGYEPIGMDHFARGGDELALAAAQGRLHRNFMGYTTRPADEMLAFGVTAIGEVDGAFVQNHKDVPEWSACVERGELPTHRGHRRSAEDDQRRAIVLDLMCRFHLAFADHGGRLAFAGRYAAELQRLRPMVDDGLCTIDDAGIRVTPVGRLLVRNLCMAFDAYLDHQAPASPGRFSRTV
ncbi:MAG TPA: oxygen-independent coproporphyrinogen III oxidase [Planctomycetota bacterium]|nr:oxygen-independent coproporphyrinogen III oxidase [Planctomycetota bacterium]